MKTGNLKYFLFLLLVCILHAGCVGFASYEGVENDVNPETTYRIIEIDSCEYVFISRRPYSSEMAMSHKGNCKYCKQR